MQADQEGIIEIHSKMQADALYHLGDFEHALVFYHRGLRCEEIWHPPSNPVVINQNLLARASDCIFDLFAGFPPKSLKSSALVSEEQRRQSLMLSDQR